MTVVFREHERVEHRVLGALRCVDATTLAAIERPLIVGATGARIVRNRSGLYVIAGWNRLPAHEASFDRPPAAPAVASETLVLDLRDPEGVYVSRRVTVALPRDPALAEAAGPGSLFQSIEVPMYASAAAPVSANWVELRATVTETATGDALGGALLRVVTATRVLARGLTDWRGEALVPVAGVPVTTWSTDPDAVVVSEIAASLECYFDPAAGARTSAADVRAGRPPARLPWPDPQALEDARASLAQATVPLVLAAGRRLPVSIAVPVP